MSTNRISSLDSFRFLAITFVVLYHYFSRWTLPESTINYYPYFNKYSNNIFQSGFIGVEFFFIISGFVIFFTLENSKSFNAFFLRRLIRLYPALIFCSVLTFVSIPFLDSDQKFAAFHNSILDFIPTLTFSGPNIWNSLLKQDSIKFIDSVNWSLIIEVRFYFIAALIYFVIKGDFFLRWLQFTLTVNLIVIIFYLLYGESKILTKLVEFSTINYLPFFTLGIIFYYSYSNRFATAFAKYPVIIISAILSSLIICIISADQRITYVSIIILMILISLFFFMIFKPKLISILDQPIISKIGVVSYSIYLLHQNIGLILIHYFSSYIHKQYLFAIPLVVYVIITLIATVIYHYFEVPISRYLKNVIKH